MNPNIRTEVVEVIVPASLSTEITLGRLPNISEAKYIHRIEAFHVGQQTKAPSRRDVVNTPCFISSFLRLINRTNVDLRYIPLTSISKNVNGTAIPALDVEQIDPEKSKIIVGDAATLVPDEVFLLVITYEKK